MRTNLTGFALTVGMGLIVVMLGFLGLSAADLVGFSADDAREKLDRQLNEEAEELRKHDISYPATHSFVPSSGKEAAAIAAGDALFKANCTQCHAVNEKVVGPALAGITKRRPTSWIVSWVHNPAKVIAGGDEYAVKLFSDYGKQQMPSFPQLSKKEIEDIIAYVSTQLGTDDKYAFAQVNGAVKQ
jgi:mono/diheme cytochrome c family protein